MLKTRIIPVMLWKDLTLVKGVGFDSWRRTGTILPTLKVYNTRQVDELMIMDITATEENRQPDYEAIADFSAECFVPLTIGGGVKSVEDVRALLRAGADKVAINSSSYRNHDLIRQAVYKFGSQCIVGSIDVKRDSAGRYKCYSQRGQRAEDIDPVNWAKELEARGVGEILITSIDRDGTMKGYDIEQIKMVSGAVSIPVIASGGAGSYKDFYDALTQGEASAVAAASIFHFTEQTPLEAKRYLAKKGISVRDVHKFKET